MSVITVQQAVKHSIIIKQTSIKKNVFEKGQFSPWQNVVMSATSEKIQCFIMSLFGSSACRQCLTSDILRNIFLSPADMSSSIVKV